ncbi:MD27B-like protein [Mya arenaria]|uniref:MD27B-like protein n=1 Tax=Mya arenaria TaxID=6604 RepID=A0ABY7DK79_MYAAR|nr:MD27B-like protein [Mya arenaria]
MSDNQTETILQAIKLTQRLRSSVAKVFQNLADGCAIEKGTEKKKAEKEVLNKFHESLLSVNNDISELEKTGSALTSLSPVTPNSIYLSIDPAIDKMPVYQQVLQAYKWSNKVSELAGYAANILDTHNKFKRTQTSLQPAKRLKRTPPTGHAYSPNAVETLLSRRTVKIPEMTITPTHPLGSHAVLQISLGRVLRAQVALRGLMIEWVNVRGFTEDNPDESKTWFGRYRTLFSAPCLKCGKHYLNGLPPTWRDLRTSDPYHDVCRQ